MEAVGPREGLDQGHPADFVSKMPLPGRWAALLAVAVAAVVMEAWAAFPFPLLLREVNGEAELNCSGFPGEEVEWRYEGKTWESNLESSQHLHLRNLDVCYAGNYSCWAGSRLLRSFYVAVMVNGVHLIDDREGQEDEPDINCWTGSYSGILNCSWKSLRPATFQIQLKHKESDALLCPSTEVTVPRAGTVHVLLENCSFCPYAEERALLLELKGLSGDGGYADVKKPLSLREIVKPDAPKFLSVVGQRISWAPPGSWNLPATYFPLHYNLHLESASGERWKFFVDGLELTTEQAENWQKGWIRCQDRLINSTWSPWQEWKPKTPMI